jgi:Predicted integral membrane protein (DUF2269)
MDLYELLLAIHILAAVIWVGGATSLQVLAIRATGSGDPVRMATFAGEAEWVGMRVFVPASIVVLLAGIALVLEGSWGFDQLWILIGLAGIAFSIVTGAGFIGPESGRLEAFSRPGHSRTRRCRAASIGSSRSRGSSSECSCSSSSTWPSSRGPSRAQVSRSTYFAADAVL